MSSGSSDLQEGGVEADTREPRFNSDGVAVSHIDPGKNVVTKFQQLSADDKANKGGTPESAKTDKVSVSVPIPTSVRSNEGPGSAIDVCINPKSSPPIFSGSSQMTFQERMAATKGLRDSLPTRPPNPPRDLQKAEKRNSYVGNTNISSDEGEGEGEGEGEVEVEEIIGGRTSIHHVNSSQSLASIQYLDPLTFPGEAMVSSKGGGEAEDEAAAAATTPDGSVDTTESKKSGVARKRKSIFFLGGQIRPYPAMVSSKGGGEAKDEAAAAATIPDGSADTTEFKKSGVARKRTSIVFLGGQIRPHPKSGAYHSQPRGNDANRDQNHDSAAVLSFNTSKEPAAAVSLVQVQSVCRCAMIAVIIVMCLAMFVFVSLYPLIEDYFDSTSSRRQVHEKEENWVSPII